MCNYLKERGDQTFRSLHRNPAVMRKGKPLTEKSSAIFLTSLQQLMTDANTAALHCCLATPFTLSTRCLKKEIHTEQKHLKIPGLENRRHRLPVLEHFISTTLMDSDMKRFHLCMFSTAHRLEAGNTECHYLMVVTAQVSRLRTNQRLTRSFCPSLDLNTAY